MGFPKNSKENTEDHIKITRLFLVEKYELILDKNKCAGCGQCSIVCPRDAILLEDPKVIVEKKPSNYRKEVVADIDEEKCIYCGTCEYFCPFDAIFVYHNDEKVERENLKIIEQKTLPELEIHPQKISQLKRDGRIYWEGEITVNFMENAESASEQEVKDFYHSTCPDECRACEMICPTDAITIKSEEETVKNRTSPIDVDSCLCIHCGACAFICPEHLIAVRWTKINASGAYNSIFYNPIEGRLLSQIAYIRGKGRVSKVGLFSDKNNSK